MDVPVLLQRAREEILQPIYDEGINAVIAGGFVRDALLGRPYEDVDLYINHSNADRVHEILGTDAPAETDWLDSDHPAYKHQSVAAQYDVESEALGGCTVNLVLLNGKYDEVTPQIVVSKFNIGLCMVGISAADMYVSEEFRRDAGDEQITLLRTDWGYEASLKQWIRLQAKYKWPLRLAGAA